MSATKKMRVLLLIKLRDDFFQLADSSWENPIVRKSLSREVAGTHELAGRSVLNETSCVEEHEAAWALLQVVAMDADYLRQTEFNPFTLIRFGNKFLNQDPVGLSFILRKINNTERSSGYMGNISESQSTVATSRGDIPSGKSLQTNRFWNPFRPGSVLLIKTTWIQGSGFS